MPKKLENITINPEDFTFDERGELKLANLELASKLKESLKGAGGIAGSVADNYIGCGGNAYQCGGALDGMDELINVARRAKTPQR